MPFRLFLRAFIYFPGYLEGFMPIRIFAINILALTLVCIVFAVGAAQPAPTLSGKVVNARGIGLAGVSVLLVNKSTRTTTDATGNFSFGPLPVRSELPPFIDIQPFFDGKAIRFLLPAVSNVAIDLFDANGRRTLLSAAAKLKEGVHSIPVPLHRNSGLSVIRMNIDNREYTFSWVRIGEYASVKGGRDLQPVRLGKSGAAAVDTIVASKHHYAEQRIALDSYSGNKTITLVFSPPQNARAVYSESVPYTIGASALYVWDNSGTPSTQFNASSTADRFEGAKACRVQGGNAGWSGWGIATTATAGADLTAYAGGSVHFAIKGSMTNVGAWVIWKNDNKTALSVDISNYGYVPGDSLWHEVSIPLSVFGPADLAHIDYFLALESPFNHGVYVANSWYVVDNIYWAQD
jgi:hypothetical protein